MQTVPTMVTMERPKLTVAEVAAMHRISRSTIYRWIDAGELAAERVGFQWRIDEDDARAISRRPIAA
jgi:excisionase family DNA binding protein